MLKAREMAHLALTKGFIAMSRHCHAVSFRMNPPPPFLLTQNIDPKDITRGDVMNLSPMPHIYVISG